MRLIRFLVGLARRASSRRKPFPGAALYWEHRYRSGGSSGCGSYGRLAEFKAETLNEFVSNHGIHSVIEYGCGDGNQLMLAQYTQYLGFDVSPTAVERCTRLFKHDSTKAFFLMEQYGGQQADLTLSLDVIFHLTDDDIFHDYMKRLFESSNRFVIVYSSDAENDRGHFDPHVRQRRFSSWIESYAPEWRLRQHIPNRYPYRGDDVTGSMSDFYIWERTQ